MVLNSLPEVTFAESKHSWNVSDFIILRFIKNKLRLCKKAILANTVFEMEGAVYILY